MCRKYNKIFQNVFELYNNLKYSKHINLNLLESSTMISIGFITEYYFKLSLSWLSSLISLSNFYNSKFNLFPQCLVVKL